MDLREQQHHSYAIQQRHPWELARLKVIRQLLKTRFKPVIAANNAAILDIGCGDIFLVNNLKDIFGKARFYAVDTAFNDETIQQVKEQYPAFNVSLHTSIAALAHELKTPAQLVLLLDVIEHIEDERSFLKELLQLSYIDNSTLFLITVPAFQSLFCKHDTFLGHYRRYTNNTLRQRLRESGMDVVFTGYFFNLLLYPRILSAVMEKMQKANAKTAEGIGNWRGSKWLSAVLKNVLYCDFYITYVMQKVGIKIPGLSNYAICKKSV